MRLFLLPFSPRYILFTLAVVGTANVRVVLWHNPDSIYYLAAPLAFFAFFTALGIRDLTQTKHAILRNYPIAAHLRFLLENIRPEMRQYFFEADKDGSPFPRDKRAIVYQLPSASSTSARSEPSTTSTRLATNGCIIRSRPRSRCASRSAS
jgi:hypothetical protein